MSRLDWLIAELCPDGVEYMRLNEIYNFVSGEHLNVSTD